MTRKRPSKFKDIFDQKNEPAASPIEEVEPPVPAPVLRRRQKAPAKSKDPNYTPVTLYLRKGTYQNVQIRLLAMGQRREVSELVGDLLEAWLDENGHSKV